MASRKVYYSGVKAYDDFIEELRKQNIAEISRHFGMSPNTLSAWVSLKNVPSFLDAAKIADYLGFEFLMFDKEE